MNKKATLLKVFFSIMLAIGALTASNQAKKKASTKIKAPRTEKSYTIQKLFDLINTNNPNKSSNFLIATKGHTPITHKEAKDWETSGIDGSASASKIKLNKAWVQEHADMTVILHEDQDLVDYLNSNKRLSTADMPSYLKLLLYFKVEINGETYRAYINDPWPGKVKNVGGKTLNPAKAIIKKWKI